MVYIAKNADEKVSVEMAEDGKVFDQLSTKTALVVGLVGSVMALCTVGFVVLLWLVFR